MTFNLIKFFYPSIRDSPKRLHLEDFSYQQTHIIKIDRILYIKYKVNIKYK